MADHLKTFHIPSLKITGSNCCFLLGRNSVERLISRGFSRQESLKRINTQIAIEKKVRQTEYVVHNDGQIEETKKQVREIYRSLVALEKSVKP